VNTSLTITSLSGAYAGIDTADYDQTKPHLTRTSCPTGPSAAGYALSAPYPLVGFHPAPPIRDGARIPCSGAAPVDP